MSTKKRRRAPARRSSTKSKRAPVLDPVSAYARAVLDGEIVTGRAVRLACERHFRDLARQRTEAFPYYFDADAAQHIIDFFPMFLTLEDGSPFHLAPWLQFSLGSVFGWKRAEDGMRRFHTGYHETGKGSGKSPTLAGAGLYCLRFDGENAAQVYSCGFDKDQASIILKDAIRMAEDSPDLMEAGIDAGKFAITHEASHSFFQATSSEHRSKSGPRPSCVLADEIHEHRDGTVINKLRAGFKFRKQPLFLGITNSGHDRTSICWAYHEHSLKVLEGQVEDEQWFAYVCQLDPCETCFADGHRQPREDCDKCDQWTDPAVWPKTNPALGLIIQPSYLASQVKLAMDMPSEAALVKRLNFCLWTETHQVWIPSDRWQACRVASIFDELDGARAAAFDMSEKLDLTSCVVGRKFEQDAGAGEPQTIDIVEVEDEEEVVKTFALNFYVELETFFWLPRATLIAREKTERIPYPLWESQGHLRVTDGPVIDYDQIFREFTEEIGPRYKPQRVGYDPHNATQFALQLRDKKKYTVVEVAQGRKLSEAFKLFEALVMLKRIRHRGNPVMGFCVSNAEPKRDRYQNLWVEKPSQTKRIDGLVAAVIVLSQLMVLPLERRQKRRLPYVYKATTHGTPQEARP